MEFFQWIIYTIRPEQLNSVAQWSEHCTGIAGGPCVAYFSQPFPVRSYSVYNSLEKFHLQTSLYFYSACDSIFSRWLVARDLSFRFVFFLAFGWLNHNFGRSHNDIRHNLELLRGARRARGTIRIRNLKWTILRIACTLLVERLKCSVSNITALP